MPSTLSSGRACSGPVAQEPLEIVLGTCLPDVAWLVRTHPCCLRLCKLSKHSNRFTLRCSDEVTNLKAIMLCCVGCG
jgi:hypothetical protein